MQSGGKCLINRVIAEVDLAQGLYRFSDKSGVEKLFLLRLFVVCGRDEHPDTISLLGVKSGYGGIFAAPLTYLPFVLGSLLFIFVGGVLLFGPERFVAAGRWWGRKIGFPEAHYEWKADRSFTWRNWRLPGLLALCFGLYMLFAVVRSLMREGPSVPTTTGTTSVANQHQAHWYALASDAIPIALGVYLLLRTEKILARVKSTRPEQANANDGLNPARYLFKAIGSLAIVAGLVFLLRHIFSL